MNVRRVGWLLVAVWASTMAVIAFVASWSRLGQAYVGTDFPTFFTPARILAANPLASGIYNQPTLAHAFVSDAGCRTIPGALGGIYPYPYAFPPLFAILLEPLSGLSCGTAAHVWQIVSLLSWWCSALLAAGLARRAYGRMGPGVVAFVLVLFSPVTSQASAQGNIFTEITLIVLLAFWFWPSRPALAGGLLALAAWIQVFPGLLLVYAVLSRDWRVVRGAALASIAILLVMLVRAPRALVEFPFGMLHGASWAVATAGNGALIGLPLVGIPLELAVIGLWVLLSLRLGRPRLAGYAWTLATATLIAPVMGYVYLLYLTPAFAAAATHASRPATRARIVIALGLTETAMTIAWVIGGPGPVRLLWLPPVLVVVWALVGSSLPDVGRALSPKEGKYVARDARHPLVAPAGVAHAKRSYHLPHLVKFFADRGARDVGA